MALTHLPHFKNIKSGVNHYDPVHSCVFEVYFQLPEPLQQQFGEDAALLTEQVVSITGLDALQRTTPSGVQKFNGVDVSYLNPMLESTRAELTMTFNLNLRNVTDNFVFKIFRAWENPSYDLSDGTRGIKVDYTSDVLRVAEANRNGEIWRSYIFHNLMLTGVSGMDELNYGSSDARMLQVNMIADTWDDDMG